MVVLRPKHDADGRRGLDGNRIEHRFRLSRRLVEVQRQPVAGLEGAALEAADARAGMQRETAEFRGQRKAAGDGHVGEDARLRGP
jgi:hypothetical protein